MKKFIKWIFSGWMLILFFVGFFLFWEYSIPLFDIPRYILPAPSEIVLKGSADLDKLIYCLLYTSPSPRDRQKSRMPSSA